MAWLNASTPLAPEAALRGNATLNRALWHRRLCHIGADGLKQAIEGKVTTGLVVESGTPAPSHSLLRAPDVQVDMDISIQTGADPVVIFWAFRAYWFCGFGPFVGQFSQFIGFPFLVINHSSPSARAGAVLALLQHLTRVWGASGFCPWVWLLPEGAQNVFGCILSTESVSQVHLCVRVFACTRRGGNAWHYFLEPVLFSFLGVTRSENNIGFPKRYMKYKENPECMCITITAAGPNLLVQVPYPLNCSSPHGQHKSRALLSRRARKRRARAAGTGTGWPAVGAGYGRRVRAWGEDSERGPRSVLCGRRARARLRAHGGRLLAAGVFARL
jgi:hypothetical protein